MKHILIETISATAAYLLFLAIPDIHMDRNTAFGYIALYYMAARLGAGKLAEVIKEKKEEMQNEKI